MSAFQQSKEYLQEKAMTFNLKGNSRFIPLKDKTISCVFTSPPYWYLRKYDIPDQIWDGDTNCEHNWGEQIKYLGRKPSHGVSSSSMGVGSVTKDIGSEGDTIWDSGFFCKKCGAWKGQLGLEPNFEDSTVEIEIMELRDDLTEEERNYVLNGIMFTVRKEEIPQHLLKYFKLKEKKQIIRKGYISHLIQIFDEAWRVLRDDGTFFLNIGDTYSTVSGSMKDGVCNSSYKSKKFKKSEKFKLEQPPHHLQQIQDKSLCGIPFRLATRMIDRGWRLRNTIIWKKPNNIPNSAKDRFSVDFEYIFFFVKSSKYWFDQPLEPYDKPLDRWGGDSLIPKGVRNRPNPEGRIKRCVWTIPTKPYKGSHYASFPAKLCEEVIKAGCPEFICKKCGKPRERIIEYDKSSWLEVTEDMSLEEKERIWGSRETKRIDKGLSDCGCGEGWKPGAVLDPFAGSGTTMKTAMKLRRIGVSLDLGYHELSKERSKSSQHDWGV